MTTEVDHAELEDLGATGARFTHRIVALEEPRIVEELESLAYGSGSSVAAQVRAAIRYWLQAHEVNR